MKLKLAYDIRSLPITKIALLVITVVLFIFITLPVQSKNSDLRMNKETADKKLESLKQVSSELETLSKLMSKLQSDKALLDKAIPNDPGIPLFLGQLQSLANESKVTITNLSSALGKESPKNINNEGDFIQLEAQMAVSGSFDQLISFLKKVETSLRLIEPIGLSLSTTTDGKVNLTTKIKSYYFLSAETGSQAQATTPTATTSTTTTTTTIQTKAVELNLGSPEHVSTISSINGYTFYSIPINVDVGVGKDNPFE